MFVQELPPLLVPMFLVAGEAPVYSLSILIKPIDTSKFLQHLHLSRLHRLLKHLKLRHLHQLIPIYLRIPFSIVHHLMQLFFIGPILPLHNLSTRKHHFSLLHATTFTDWLQKRNNSEPKIPSLRLASKPLRIFYQPAKIAQKVNTSLWKISSSLLRKKFTKQ